MRDARRGPSSSGPERFRRVLRVRILGAGVAGTAAAALITAAGHEVELIDEDFAQPALGTSLALFPPAQRVLARIGVLDAVTAGATAPREGRLVGRDGRMLATLPSGEALLVPRPHLLACLRRALPSEVRRRRMRVQDVRPLRRGADVLVGADGLHSLTRLSGWGEGARARGHGMTILRGITPQAPPEISETWGGGWLFGITPLSGGGTNWFASVPEHRAPDREGDLAHLSEVVGGARAAIDTVLEASTPARTTVHGLFTVPRVRPVREDVVLIGDAAHAMAPNLGHGANTALSDAAALATALDGAQRIRPALARYAARRHLVDQGWRLGSEVMLRAGMADGLAGGRDTVLGAAGRILARRSREDQEPAP
ncbi:FAD-dependent monooxygenase [Brachybacterium subflavum]|uniref:FAD-dependent monooxygenase n=1 Tax=Brachybacterium subflavum TaxID=2585206 RepID=UPI001D0D7E50|nr:FAD-dependent monooxygenase [Brachybacterium subflavum]